MNRTQNMRFVKTSGTHAFMNAKKVLFTLTFALSLLFSGTASAQNYAIKLTLDDVKDTTVYLANYFGSKLYYADTAAVNSKGVALFEGKEALHKGGNLFSSGPNVIIDSGFYSFCDLCLFALCGMSNEFLFWQ